MKIKMHLVVGLWLTAATGVMAQGTMTKADSAKPIPTPAVKVVVTDNLAKPSPTPAANVGAVESVTQPKRESSPSANKNVITNESVIKMVKGGFTEAVILNLIQTSERNLDLTLDGLFALKNGGVSQQLIEKIQAAVARPTTVSSTTGGVDTTQMDVAGTVRLVTESDVKSLPQPFVLTATGNGRSVIPGGFPTIVQTNAKGENIGALLADATITNIAGQAIVDVAVRGLMSSPGIAAVPILGMAGAAITMIPNVFKKEPTYTYVYALPGRASKNIASSTQPSFDLQFGDVVGVDPDLFEPALIKIHPTPNNWRLVGAQKSKAKYFQSADKVTYNFIEQPISADAVKIGRGQYSIKPKEPLPPGEYAIVMRPISKEYKLSYKDITYKIGEGSLVYSAWDFAVQDPEKK